MTQRLIACPVPRTAAAEDHHVKKKKPDANEPAENEQALLPEEERDILQSDRRALLFMLYMLQRALRKPLTKVMGDYGLTPSEGLTLIYIADNDGVSAAALSRLLEITPQGVNTLMKGLVYKELVERSESAHSKRALQIRLTSQGRLTLVDLRSSLRELEADIVSFIAPKDIMPLRVVLLRLLGNYSPSILADFPYLFSSSTNQ